MACARRSTRSTALSLVVSSLIFCVTSVLVSLSRVSAQDGAAPSASYAIAPAEFIGAAACANCHPGEREQWQGSQHAAAMQEANDKTVLGNFDNGTFSQGGVTSIFFKKNGRWWVRTDGPEGALTDFEIRFTFGIYPLQQYLIEFPNGRFQALGIAWDARPKEEGGQRWFHLYPGQHLKAGHPLHWTEIDKKWNYQCAYCHSTNLRKNYNCCHRSIQHHVVRDQRGVRSLPRARHRSRMGVGLERGRVEITRGSQHGLHNEIQGATR